MMPCIDPSLEKKNIMLSVHILSVRVCGACVFFLLFFFPCFQVHALILHVLDVRKQEEDSGASSGQWSAPHHFWPNGQTS